MSPLTSQDGNDSNDNSVSNRTEARPPSPEGYNTDDSFYPIVEKIVDPNRSWLKAMWDNVGGLVLCFFCLAIWVLVILLALSDWGRGLSDADSSPSTPAPTPMPSVDVPSTPSPVAETESFWDLLPSFSREAIRADPGSPQGKAWQWVQQDDNAQYSDERLLQRFALVTLYQATDGDQWNFIGNHQWLSHDASECSWYSAGIVCSGETNIVEVLYLPKHNLFGTLPPELGILKSLAELSLGTNPQLQGSIPSTIGLLTLLDGLDLHQNGLTGSMPTEIGYLTGLTWLTVASQSSGSDTLSISRQGNSGSGSDKLSSTIPTQMGRLTKLKNLRMESNQFEGTIPLELENLTALQTLTLSDNQLTGSLPPSWGRQMSDLRVLQLDGNIGLTGTVPVQWGAEWPLLQRLWLQDTSLNGSVPVSLCFLNTDSAYVLDSLRVDCAEVSCDCNCWCA
jgi:hypothetical protein